jgi:hypothetical protein
MKGPGKGKTNNPNGRPAGSPNKVTKLLRDRVSDFLNKKWPQVEKDFDQLDPKDKIILYERLMQYIIPRMQATELSFDETKPDSNFLRKAKERVMQILNEED